MNKIYHYTKLSNVEKIIKQDKIDFLATYFEQFAEDDYKWIKERQQTVLEDMCKDEEDFDPDYLSFSPYIISFCDKSNSEYMWQKYGDGSKGCVLILDKDLFKAETSIDNLSCIVPCEYVKEDIKDDELRNVIEKVADLCYPDYYSYSYYARCLFAVIGLKKDQFNKEEEIRYVEAEKMVAKVIYDREKNKAIVHDYKVPKDKWRKQVLFSSNVLCGIIIGKNVNEDEYIRIINHIEDCGYNSAIVQKMK